MPPQTVHLFPAQMTVLANVGGTLLTAFVTVAVGTALVRRWAVRRGYVDHPDGWRRIHGAPTSNVGGVAVALGSAVTFLVWAPVAVPHGLPRPDLLAGLLGGLLMFAVGFRDDLRHIPAGVKLTLQALVATGVFVAGVRFTGAGLYPSGTAAPLLLSYAATTFWIVGTTNAFNLIDGADGVATGAALFGAVALGAVCALNGEPLGTLLAVVLVGATLAFLAFNFPPASIFLGDGGSLFLGFTLATLGVIAANAADTGLALLIPAAALGLPLVDTALAIVRRFLRREPIFSPDRGHVHHRLRSAGLTPRGVALTTLAASSGFAATAVLLAWMGPRALLPVLLVFPVVLVVGIARLRMPELVELGHLIRRGFQGRAMVARNLRVHAASEVLRSSVGGVAVTEALEYAFNGSEFSRLELWLPSGPGAALTAIGNGHVTRSGEGFRLVLSLRSGPVDPGIDVRIPMALEGGQSGDLHLFRAGDSEMEVTDLQLVRAMLVPALAAALAQVGIPQVVGLPQAHVSPGSGAPTAEATVGA